MGSLTMSKSVYLELDDVISFKEFVISMRKGSLQNQIRKQAMEHYGDFPDLGSITVASVRLDLNEDGLRIIPEFNRVIENEYEQTPDTLRKKTCTQLKENTSWIKCPSDGHDMCPMGAAGGRCHRMKCNICIKEPPESKISLHQIRETFGPQSKIVIPKKATKIITKGTNSERQKELEEIVRVRNEEREVWNATNGKGSGVYSELANLKRDMSGSVHKMARKHNQKNYKLQTEHRGKNWWMVPKPRQGYKWTRDYDSTDEENMWDRIGSMFGANTDRSGNDSVSEGDYCIHDHRRCTV